MKLMSNDEADKLKLNDNEDDKKKTPNQYSAD